MAKRTVELTPNCHPGMVCHASASKTWMLGSVGSLILALIVQSGTLAWWAGSIQARVGHVEIGLERLTDRVHDHETGEWRARQREQ